MKGFDVLKVKSAVKTHNKFDLSRTHLTTMDFGQIVPLFVEETVPGDKFQIDAEYFSRTAPLTLPTYGKFNFKTVSAYVPYHQVAVDAEAWLDGKTTWEGQTPHHRFITYLILHNFVYQYCLDTTLTPSAGAEDYSWIDASGTTQRSFFSNEGKYYVKILNALGYALPQGVDLRTTSSWYTGVADVRLSAYPLLAFFKLYNDYMSQSQRFNTSAVSSALNKIKYNIADSSIWSSSTGQINVGGLAMLFLNIKLNYENDYFTSAWQNPNNPIAATESVNSMNVSGQSGVALQQSVSNNFLNIQENSPYQSVTLSQRALDFLKSFDDWVRRNNYSGSRAVQQVYSRFGIKTDEYKSHYAHVINTDSMPIQVGDVTATADAGGLPLGDYAGKAILSGKNGVSMQCDDYGVLFILGYFTVVPMNAFGSDRRVLRNSPLDYYNPEFDGLGADAISLGEVFASPVVAGSDTTSDRAVFGYTERYNAYRYGRDVITGDFRDYHFGSMAAWHTGRDLSAIRAQNGLVAQSSSVNTLPQSDSEYNRMFNVVSGVADHFYLTARFNVDAIRPMLNLNQVVNLGEGDTRVPRNGNVIS